MTDRTKERGVQYTRFGRCYGCEHAKDRFDPVNRKSVYLVCELLNGKWTAEIDECPEKQKENRNEDSV